MPRSGALPPVRAMSELQRIDASVCRRLMGAVSEAVIKGGAEAEAALSAAERRRDGRARVAALADMATNIVAAQQ